jgi:hypothetical protein
MKATLRRILDSDLSGALALALLVSLVFGVLLYSAPSARAQGGDGTSGTLPVVISKSSPMLSPGTVRTLDTGSVRLVVASSQQGTADFNSNGAATVHRTSWRCKHVTHELVVTQAPGESSESFEARCVVELAAATRNFQPDDT